MHDDRDDARVGTVEADTVVADTLHVRSIETPAPVGPPTTRPDTVRITAELPLGTIEILRELAASQKITLQTALRNAIATEGLIRRDTTHDSRVLIQSADGALTELPLKR